MKLSKVTRQTSLNEGPFDFLRGAGAEAGRRTGGAMANAGRAVAGSVGDVVRAGANASQQANLEKAVATLAALMAQATTRNQAAVQPEDQHEDKPAEQDEPQSEVPAAFRTPKASSQHEWTFNSYMQAVHGDQLDEGVFDFIKGAGGAIGSKVRDKINAYAQKPSIFKDMYTKGMDASRIGDEKRAGERDQKMQDRSDQQIDAATANLRQLAAKSNPDAVMAAIKKFGGSEANNIAKMLAPAQQSAPAAQVRPAPAAPVNAPAQPQQRPSSNNVDAQNSRNRDAQFRAMRNSMNR